MSKSEVEITYENKKMCKVNDFIGRLDVGDPRITITERLVLSNPKNHSKEYMGEKLKEAFETSGGKVHKINFIETFEPVPAKPEEQ